MAEQVDAYRKDKVFALQATASLWALLRIKPCKVQILASDIEIMVGNLKNGIVKLILSVGVKHLGCNEHIAR